MSVALDVVLTQARFGKQERAVLGFFALWPGRTMSATTLSNVLAMDPRDIRHTVKILTAVLPHYGWNVEAKLGRHGGYRLTPISPQANTTEQREVA